MFANLRQLSGSPGTGHHKLCPHSRPIFQRKYEIMWTVDTMEEYGWYYRLSLCIDIKQVYLDCTSSLNLLSCSRLSSTTVFSNGVVVQQGVEDHTSLIISHASSFHRWNQIRKGRSSHPARVLGLMKQKWPLRKTWKGPRALLYCALPPCLLQGEAGMDTVDPSFNIHLALPFYLMWIVFSASTSIGRNRHKVLCRNI